MKKPIIILMTLFFSQNLFSQSSTPIDRTQLRIMVVPHIKKGELIQDKIENDENYRIGIQLLEKYLLDNGYKPQDFMQFYENNVKDVLKKAPVDVFIDTEIFLSDPLEKQNRQAQIYLKVKDKYSGYIYGSSLPLRSYQRAYPDFRRAIEDAYKLGGKENFDNFLKQLDNSYAKLITEGRTMNLKFKIEENSDISFNESIQDKRLSIIIKEIVKEHCLKGQYKLISTDADYMEFEVQIPIIDNLGNSLSPNDFAEKIDYSLKKIGLEVEFTQLSSWVNFVIERRK